VSKRYQQRQVNNNRSFRVNIRPQEYKHNKGVFCEDNELLSR
jgi:hypothetical protein